jgi:hypothetical protein
MAAAAAAVVAEGARGLGMQLQLAASALLTRHILAWISTLLWYLLMLTLLQLKQRQQQHYLRLLQPAAVQQQHPLLLQATLGLEAREQAGNPFGDE